MSSPSIHTAPSRLIQSRSMLETVATVHGASADDGGGDIETMLLPLPRAVLVPVIRTPNLPRAADTGAAGRR
ncbi:hypothetical protein GCM10011490_08400 [Pseudoclavibacter endophyticus]|nr:hypothetical protein GCM10011490_08400 [Pseudoclavibacter endophyticus]